MSRKIRSVSWNLYHLINSDRTVHAFSADSSFSIFIIRSIFNNLNISARLLLIPFISSIPSLFLRFLYSTRIALMPELLETGTIFRFNLTNFSPSDSTFSNTDCSSAAASKFIGPLTEIIRHFPSFVRLYSVWNLCHQQGMLFQAAEKNKHHNRE